MKYCLPFKYIHLSPEFHIPKVILIRFHVLQNLHRIWSLGRVSKPLACTESIYTPNPISRPCLQPCDRQIPTCQCFMDVVVRRRQALLAAQRHHEDTKRPSEPSRTEPDDDKLVDVVGTSDSNPLHSLHPGHHVGSHHHPGRQGTSYFHLYVDITESPLGKKLGRI